MGKTGKRFAAGLAAMTLCCTAGAYPSAARAAYGVGGNGKAIMEYLDRGICAVRSGSGMFVSWRFNGNDADDAAFQLFRDDQLIYTSSAGDPTCFQDDGGSAASRYRVDTVQNGTVISSDGCRLTSGTNYFDIPLDVPAGGVINGEAYSYSPNDTCCGDADGDGQYELFVKWDPSNSKDNSQVTDPNKGIQGVTANVLIDCYTLDGKKLWRIDLGRNIRAGQHYTQLAVADFDCDGRAELVTKTCDGTVDGRGKVIGNGNAVYVDNGSGTVLTGPEYMTLFDGLTGEALDTIEFPVLRGDATSNAAKSTWGDNYGNRCERYNCAIAYLDGIHPSLIYGRGYYTRLTLSAVDVRDKKLVKRWVFDTGFDSSHPAYGCGNHNVMVADFDNDGRQEVCMGASCIDDDGRLLWSTGQGHGDAMHIGDLDPNHEGIEVFLCHEAGNYGISLVDGRNGQLLWHYDGDKDTGRCCAANCIPGNGGAEFWGSRPAGAVYNAAGQQIGNKQPATNFLIYWDGDLERELLNDVTISKMPAANQFADIFTAADCASNNGTKAVPCLTADLFGDWREELVLRTADNSRLRIFCTTDKTDYRLTTLMHDMQYRMQTGCEQSSYNQPPHPSFWLGTGDPLPARPDIQLNNTPPEPVSGRFIKDLKVRDYANLSGWEIADGLRAGTQVFGDRDYTYTEVPALFSESPDTEYLRTACNSKNTDADLAEFKAEQDLTVYVLADIRLEQNGLPAWLSDWERTDLMLTTSNDVTFRAYRKDAASGATVLLGTNGMSGNVVNYTAAVLPQSHADTTTTTTTTTTTETTTESETEAPEKLLRGDVDVNGTVQIADAVLLARYLAEDQVEVTVTGLRNAELDGDDSGLTAADLGTLLQILAGSIRE